MEEQKSGAMKIITPIATLIIGAIIGYMAGVGQTGTSNPEVARLQAQIDEAKKMFPPMPEMRSISGKILSVSGNTITIESMASINPFETLPKERTITVTSSTKLISMEQKDQVSFQKEMEVFSKQMSSVKPGSAPSAPIMPPMPFNEKTISLSDLTAGIIINVEASENIKEKASFIATKITTSPAPSMPTPPTR